MLWFKTYVIKKRTLTQFIDFYKILLVVIAYVEFAAAEFKSFKPLLFILGEQGDL